jgi:hypothetical protein
MRTVPGSGAIVTPNFNIDYGVESFTIVNGGTGYAATDPPQINILNTQPPTISGSFFPVIVGGGITSISILEPGRGYFPLAVGVTAVGIASLGSDQNVVAVHIVNPGIGYTENPSVTISAASTIGVGTFVFNEIVTGQTSGTIARVKDFRTETSNIPGVLSSTNLRVAINSGKFIPGEIIVGSISSARYAVEEYDDSSHADTYDRNEEIELEADSILDFTESNPFGDY